MWKFMIFIDNWVIYEGDGWMFCTLDKGNSQFDVIHTKYDIICVI